MKKRILIAGYYGYGNAGDELILACMLSGFREQHPDLRFTVLSGNPAHTQTRHKVEAIAWDDFPGIIETVRTSDLCILGGGGLIQDYWGMNEEHFLVPAVTGLDRYLNVPFLANLFAKPVVWYALGIGPLFTDEARACVRLAASLCDGISVRDERSRDNLERLFADEPESAPEVFVTADPGFLYETPASRTAVVDSILGSLDPRRPVLGVNVRYWGIDADPDVYPQEIARALDRYIRREGAQVLFIPFQSKTGTPYEDDAAIHRLVHEHMTAQVHAHLVDIDLQPDDIPQLIQISDLFLGMRYHALLLALLNSTPAVGLAYDPKVESLFEEASLGQLSLPMSRWRSDAIYDRLISAPGIFTAEKVAGTIHSKQALAEEEISRVCRIVGGEREARHVSPEVIAFLLQRLQAADEQQAALEERLHDAQEVVQQRDDLLKHMEALEESLVRLEGEKRPTEAVVEDLERYISERDTQILQLENQLITAREQLSALHSQHDAFTASKGWKVLNAFWRPIWKIREYYSSFLEKVRNSLNIHRPQSLTRLVGSKAWFRFLVATSRHPDFSRRRVTLFVKPDSDYLSEYRPRRILPTKLDGSKRVTLVVVGKDEQSSVERWFSSLHKQERLPDELICIDNGSSDQTYELMKVLANQGKYKQRTIKRVDGTLAFCRNFGVEQSNNEIIVMTDLGCELKEDWLKNIVAPFEIDPTIDVVAGLYQGSGENSLLREMIPDIESIDPHRFLPATRSIAFTKIIWKKVNGFPEWLTYSGEDTYFDLELIRANARWALVPDAQVLWGAPTSLRGVWGKIYSWSSGDGESGAFYNKYLEIYLVGTRYISLLTLGFALTLLAFLSPLKVIQWIPVPYWLGFSVLSITSILKLNNHGIAIKPFLFGRIARVIGFFSGFRRRPGVITQQFQDTTGVVIMMSGVPIDDTGGGARSAQMANEFLRLGYLVVYINRFPRNENVDLALNPFHPNLFQFSVNEFDWGSFSFLFGPLMKNKQVTALVQFPVREYLNLCKKLQLYSGGVVYDLIDNWNSSLGRGWYQRKVEEKILNIADFASVSAEELGGYIKQFPYNKKIIELPNAVNPSIFDRSKVFPRPSELEDSELIITYIGALWGEWFDWDLLWRICKEYSSASIVLIGDYKGHVSTLPPNLKLLGLKPQIMLPNYLAFTNVAIIPWKMDKITKFTSPLKIYEYIAMGLNVVAPPLETIKGMPGVYCAEGHDEFIALINEVKDIPIDQQVLDEFIKENSWENRISILNSHIGVQ